MFDFFLWDSLVFIVKAVRDDEFPLGIVEDYSFSPVFIDNAPGSVRLELKFSRRSHNRIVLVYN